MDCKGDLSVNLCERYVFRESFQCGPMQYYEQRTLISNPVYVSSSIIYDFIIGFVIGFIIILRHNHHITAKLEVEIGTW